MDYAHQPIEMTIKTRQRAIKIFTQLSHYFGVQFGIVNVMVSNSHAGTHITNMTTVAAARNYYEKHPEELESKVSRIRAFAKGALSGAGTGTLMAGIVTLISPIIPWFTLSPITAPIVATMLTTLATTAPLLILATALFSGVMAAKRAMSDAPTHDRRHNRDTMTIVPIAGLTAPMISQSQQAAPDTTEHAPTKNWVASTSREADSQSRVQQILDKGMSAQDRASALLAARDAASAEPSQRLM
jgi:hypothetical protein